MGLGASLFSSSPPARSSIRGVTGESCRTYDVDAIGAILMVIGIIGLVLSLIFWSTWGGFQGRRRRNLRLKRDRPPVRRLNGRAIDPRGGRAPPRARSSRAPSAGRRPPPRTSTSKCRRGPWRPVAPRGPRGHRSSRAARVHSSRQVRVEGADTGAVLDDDELPPAAGVSAANTTRPGPAADTTVPVGGDEVQSAVEPLASRSVGSSQRSLEGSAENERKARPAPRGPRGPRPRPTVGLEPRPHLEAAEKRFGSETEETVERARRESVPRERD